MPISEAERNWLLNLPDLRAVAASIYNPQEIEKGIQTSVNIFTIEKVYIQKDGIAPSMLVLRSSSGKEYRYIPTMMEYWNFIRKVLVAKGNLIGRKVMIEVTYGTLGYGHPSGVVVRTESPVVSITAISDKYGNFRSVKLGDKSGRV